MTDWKKVRTPPGVAMLPKDRRGYPVPIITPRTDDNIYLGMQDYWRVFWCFVDNLCSVCGGQMSSPWRFFTPPFEEEGLDNVLVKFLELTALMHEKGIIMYPQSLADEPSEAPFHFECGLYSLAVCPFLASPTAKFTALKEFGGEALDRQGKYLGKAVLASFDKLTLRASWFAPTKLIDDDRNVAINILEGMTFEDHCIPKEWSLPENELRKHVWKRFESVDRRMYHRARQGNGIWGKAF